jgi:hypothetical protein
LQQEFYHKEMVGQALDPFPTVATTTETRRRPPYPVMDDNLRRQRLHHPTLWGDFFLGFMPYTPTQVN